MNSTAKYRPVLTERNIEVLVMLCSSEEYYSRPEVQECRRVLAPFLAKIKCEAVSASYSIQPPLEVRLGMGLPKLPPVQMREAAFKKWQELGATACTVEELELVLTYRMDKGLLSEEETKQYMEAAMNEAMKKAGL